VSHNLRQIERLCARAFMLDHGRLVAEGTARDVCNQFFEASDIKIAEASKALDTRRSHASDGSIELIEVTLVNEAGQSTSRVVPGEPVTLKVHYAVHRAIEEPIFGVGIHTTDFIYLATEQSVGSLQIDQLSPGDYELEFRVRSVPLLPGVYSFRLGVAVGTSGAAAFYADRVLQFQVISRLANRAWQNARGEGFFTLEADWSVRPVAADLGLAGAVTHR
jgi:lipopolysaccharide transport system ATP-binding protein